MNTTKHTVLDVLGARLAAGPTALDAADLQLVGAAARVAGGDAEDDAEALLVDAAEALLAKARGIAVAPVAALPDTPALDALLLSPRGPFTAALLELDRLGSTIAGLSALGHSSAPAAIAHAARLAARIRDVARSSSADLLRAGEAASRAIAERGVDIEADAALVALADVVDLRLRAALGGEPLEPAAPVRAATLPAALAASLGATLARALGRATLDVSPDLLELAAPGAMSVRGADLVLHGAAAAAETHAPAPIEVLRGVRVTYRHGELVVDLSRVVSPSTVMLVAIERGEPGVFCDKRGGATPSEVVFTLTDPTPELDGWALVVGDDLAFLRRRLAEREERTRPVARHKREKPPSATLKTASIVSCSAMTGRSPSHPRGRR